MRTPSPAPYQSMGTLLSWEQKVHVTNNKNAFPEHLEVVMAGVCPCAGGAPRVTSSPVPGQRAGD